MKTIILTLAILLSPLVAIGAETGLIFDKLIVESDTITVNIPFDENNFEKIIEYYINQNKQIGFLYSSMTISRLIKNDSMVTVVVELTLGPEVKVDNIIIEGLNRTDKSTVTNRIDIKSGDVIFEQDINKLEKNLKDIPHLIYLPPVKIKPRQGYTTADLLLSFRERKQFLIEGGGSLGDAPNSSFNWNLKANFLNLFGKGREISIAADRRLENRQILNIGYRQPVDWFGRGRFGFNIETRDYRDNFYEFSAASFTELYIKQNLLFKAELGWRSVEPVGQLASYNSYRVGLGVRSGSLNDRLNPSSGMTLEWNIRFNHRKQSGIEAASKSYNEIRNDIKSSFYMNILNRFLLKISGQYRGFETDEELPLLSELYFVGGTGSLRGFRNEQFSALRTANATIEPRIQFNSGFTFAFFDAAYLNNRIMIDDNIQTDQFYRFGYGGGIALVSGEQLINIFFSWNKDIPFDRPWLTVQFISAI